MPEVRGRYRSFRERTCAECSRIDRVRSDNAGIRCGPCASRISLEKARRIRTDGVTENRRRRTKPCECCGAPFVAIGRNRFCSMTCRRAGQSTGRTCEQCGAGFRVPRSKLSGRSNSSARFCSWACYALSLEIPGSAASRGSGWLAARREALRRNPFCALCGTTRDLHVHHIQPYRLRRDNSQQNLMPLCETDHPVVEKIMRRLEEFGLPYEQALFAKRGMLTERQDATRMMLSRLSQCL